MVSVALHGEDPEYLEELATDVESRMRGIGVIPPRIAQEYGLSGANLRASGIDYDLRRDQDLPLSWNLADWKVWTHPDGDSFARFWVRLQEVREGTRIVEQAAALAVGRGQDDRPFLRPELK